MSHVFLSQMNISRREKCEEVEKHRTHTPSFAGFLSDLVRVCPLAKNDGDFVVVLLDTLKLERPAYQELHAFATARGWPDRT